MLIGAAQGAIATSGKTVLLIEADALRRTLSSRLNSHVSADTCVLLTDQAQLCNAVVSTDTPSMHFLDAKPYISNPADIISSKRSSVWLFDWQIITTT